MGFANLKKQLIKAEVPKTLALAWGTDPGVLQACRIALDIGFLRQVIVTGPKEEIESAATDGDITLDDFSIVEASTPEAGALEAVRLVRDKHCDLLMKGHLNTSTILRAVLNKEQGIRAKALLSHIAVVELPGPRLALLTDSAMNIKPDLQQKSQILDNAIQFAWSIGLENPKVAVLASVETVNPRMEDTLDAAALTLMGKRNQFTKPAVVDGPLAFDNAYSHEAANIKGIASPVAGQVDIFMAPELTAGNILYKAFNYVGRFLTAGIVYGATCPIVLTSRADSAENKLNAIAVACRALVKS